MAKTPHRFLLLLCLLALALTLRPGSTRRPAQAWACRNPIGVVDAHDTVRIVCAESATVSAASVLKKAGHRCAARAAAGWARRGDLLKVGGARCRARSKPLSARQRLLLGLAIDINHATHKELMALPRIGKTLARRIIAWREKNGCFDQIGALCRVKGIGRKTLARLAGLIRLSACRGQARVVRNAR
jgi:competence ComEA-like helix-hairpin-helix protein